MARVSKKKKREIRGAPSILTEDGPSFADDGPRRGKHFTAGRKVIHLDHVGVISPDSDPDQTSRPRRRRT